MNQHAVPRINLLPQAYVLDRRRKRKVRAFFLFSLLAAAVLAVPAIRFHWEIAQLELEKEALSSELAPLRALEAARQKLQEEVERTEKREAFLTQKRGEGLNPLSYLATLEALMPQGVTLTSLSLKKSTLSLTGVTLEPREIAVLLANVQAAFGPGVRLKGWEKREDGRYHFELGGEARFK